jgi:predicted metal-binding protein
MINYDELNRLAMDSGFTNAGPLDVSTLAFLPEVRDMCASDRCQSYGKNWACPPACGTLEEMRNKVKDYKQGLLVQTVGQLEDNMDWENMQLAAQNHADSFVKMHQALRKQYPNLLAMGAGTCTRCKACTYLEGKPCRFPDALTYSMEACGLFVSKVCTDNNLKYNHGPNTVAYTGCFLLE